MRKRAEDWTDEEVAAWDRRVTTRVRRFDKCMGILALAVLAILILCAVVL